MNFKKTWFGWLNFILSTIITGAMLIALVFVLLRNDVLFKISFVNGGNIDIISMILSSLFMLVSVGIIVLVVKLRKRIASKVNLFRSSTVSEVVGGSLSLGLFIVGIVIRSGIALNNDNVPAFNVDNVNNLFNKSVKFSFSGLHDIYDVFMAFIYRFVGQKPEAYVWVNLVILSLAILCIYAIIRTVFGGSVTVIPMAFMCLSPTISSYIVLDSYFLFNLFVYALGLHLVLSIISSLKNANEFEIWGHVLTQIAIFAGVMIIPVLVMKSLTNAPYFDLNASFTFLRMFLPFENEWLNILLICFMFAGAFSYIYSNQDRLSLIATIWMVATFIYLFSKNNWPPEALMIILFSVFAGLGFDELLFSEVYEPEKAAKVELVVKDDSKKETDNVVSDISSGNNNTTDMPKDTTDKPNDTTDMPLSGIGDVKASVDDGKTSGDDAVETTGNDNVLALVNDAVEVSENENSAVDSSSVIDARSGIDESVLLTAELTKVKESTNVAEEVTNDSTTSKAEVIANDSSDTPVTNESETNVDDESTETTKNIKLIDNPLPVPDKPVMKEMDYKLSSESYILEFDYNVSEDDDFDF